MRHRSGARALPWLLPLALFPAMGCLTDFGPPSIDGNQVVFHGSVPIPGSFGGFLQAIYMGSEDCLGVVADQFTPIPGGSGAFGGFGNVWGGGPGIPYVLDHGSPSFDAGEAAFWGAGGIYLRSGETLGVVADKNTFIPSENLPYFETNPSLRNGSVAFASLIGIYLNDGNSIRVVMDRDMPMPGFPDTVNFGHGGFSIGDGDVVAFTAGIPTLTPTGVYLYEGSSLETVADYKTRIPGRAGTFGGFGRVSADGGDVAFVGGRSASQFDLFGIYLYRGGLLSMVADTKTTVPGGTGNFADFSDVVTNGGLIDFAGRGAGGQGGLYRYSGGSLIVIADRNTPIPGGTGDFVSFPDFSVDADDNAFVARGPNAQMGIYLYQGGSLSMIADGDTAIPGGTGTFNTFLEVAMASGDIAFAANGEFQQSGIYLYSAGSLDVVLDRNTRIPPEYSLFFEGFTEVSLDSGDIVFLARPNSQVNGIYRYRGGSLSVIADWNTPVPDRPDKIFSSFSDLTVDSGQVTFIGHSSGGHQGVYSYDGISIHRVVDEDVPFPGGTSNFTSFAHAWTEEGSVAFVGTAPGIPGPRGVYQHDGNGIHRVADSRTPIPGGTGTFQRFGSGVSTDAGNVLFTGFGSDPSGSEARWSGVYLASGGSLNAVIDTQTPIPGGAGNFASATLSAESLDGNDIAFLGLDVQGNAGIYLQAGGALKMVADKNTPVPGGWSTFTKLQDAPSLHDGNVAFRSETPRGIYFFDGERLRVIANTSTPMWATCRSALR